MTMRDTIQTQRHHSVSRLGHWVACGAIVGIHLVGTTNAHGQVAGNLGFNESSTIYHDRPRAWFTGGQGYHVGLDTLVAYEGRASLRSAGQWSVAGLSNDGPSLGARQFGVATQSLPVEALRGKTVQYSGWIRTSGVTQGYAGLWLRVDGRNGTLAFDNMGDRGPSGNTDWQSFTIEIAVDSAATAVVFGVLHPGNGTAWFDALAFVVDGAPFLPAQYAAWTPSDDMLAYLKEVAIPLGDALPGGSSLSELSEMLEGLDDARIIGLGEGTHGTHEFFEAKHAIVQALVESGVAVAFAIEASMPEARLLNEYVTRGVGDPSELLRGLGFWTWNTEEVLAMLQWMRATNETKPGSVEFWGFDMQSPRMAADSVFAFVARADPEYLPTLRRRYGMARSIWQRPVTTRTLEQLRTWRNESQQVLEHLTASRAAYDNSVSDDQVAWAIQYARIVNQSAAMQLPDGASRDSSMALNVGWVAAQNPDATLVVWAHNAHVQTCDGMMGQTIAGMFGDLYHAVGLSFGDGEYTAVGPNGLAVYIEPPPPPGTLEHVLRMLDMPVFALHLRPAASNKLSALFGKPRLFRSIGSRASDGAFFATNLSACFDHLLYFDRTSASRLLQ